MTLTEGVQPGISGEHLERFARIVPLQTPVDKVAHVFARNANSSASQLPAHDTLILTDEIQPFKAVLQRQRLHELQVEAQGKRNAAFVCFVKACLRGYL